MSDVQSLTALLTTYPLALTPAGGSLLDDDVDGLGEEQHGDHEDGDKKEGPLQHLLPLEHVPVARQHLRVLAHQDHVDEGNEH